MSTAKQVEPAVAAELFIIQDQIHEPMHDRFLWATMQRRGGTDLLYWWRLLPSTALNRKRALAAYAALPIEETAVYDKYVRWCGRTGP